MSRNAYKAVTVSCDIDRSKCKTQIFKRQKSQKRSYPRIDTMPYLKVVIAVIHIASGTQFANPEGLIYSEQNLADGSVIASQQPLPLCEQETPHLQAPA